MNKKSNLNNMARQAKVYVNHDFAGILTETNEGEYIFQYEQEYYTNPHKREVSLTLPKKLAPYFSSILFPFFDGLIPEGWLLEIGSTNWKINSRDRMGLLLHLCQDCIGNISIFDFTSDNK